LAELPNYVVALRAVPDLEARQFPTILFLSGATRPAVVPFPPLRPHASLMICRIVT
jgi:hypothetical protein